MKKLTDKQIISIANLSEAYTSISAATLSNYSGFPVVDIHTKDDLSANEWESIKVAVETIFPTSRFTKARNFQDSDGDHSNYHISDGSGTGIVIYTNKKLPAPTESQEEITLDDLTTFDVIEEEWTPEQIQRQEG